MPVVCLFQRQATTKVLIANQVRLLPQKQHTADSLQRTASHSRPRSGPFRFRLHPSALIPILTVPYLVAVLGCGRPAWKTHSTPAIPPPTGLVLSVSVDGDSFLPYEPICAVATITNESNRKTAVPQLIHTYPRNAYVLSAMTEEGTALPASGRLRVNVDYFLREPAPEFDTLLPGEAVSDTEYLEHYAGIRDTTGTGYLRFPPGSYRLRAMWNSQIFPEDWPGDRDTAAFAPFTVRGPTPREESAMALHASVEYFDHALYWHEPEFADPGTPDDRSMDRGHRIDSCATAILCDFADVEPYAPLALKSLMLTAHDRTHHSPTWADSAHPEWSWILERNPGLSLTAIDRARLRAAWADSASSLWFALMEQYPGSRTAAYTLRRYRFLEVWIGTGAHEAALRKLNGRYPSTPVDAEVKRQLALIDELRD